MPEQALQSIAQWAVVIVGCLIGQAQADTLRLDYPDTTVLSRPILEFRARAADLPHHVGHVFVVFGREQPDKTTIYYAAGGFYPKQGTGVIETFKAYLKGPGHLEYNMDDLKSDITFQVKITAEQERAVKFVMNNWNEKEYGIISQNCISLIKSVGKVIGLDVGDPKAMDVTPYQLVRLLKNENDVDKPLRHAITEAKRTETIRRQDAAVVRGTIEHIRQREEEVRQSREAWQRWERGTGSQRVGVPAGPSKGTGNNPFPKDTMMYMTWPWQPPAAAP